MTFYRIIDGYNLMYAAGLARLRHQPDQFVSFRERFLEQLAARFSAEERAQIIVVLDGQATTGPAPPPAQMFGLTVQFTRVHEEADDLIERLIKAHPAPELLFVITGDRRLQTAARRRKAHYRTSKEFWAELRKVPLIDSPALPSRD